MKKNATQNKLVEVHGKKLFTTSLVIAERCGVEHNATIKLVRKFENDLKEIGKVGFQIRLNTQGSATEDDFAKRNFALSEYGVVAA